MVQGADVHNGVLVEINMAGAVGTAVIDSERRFGVVKLVYTPAYRLYRSVVALHWRRSIQTKPSTAGRVLFAILLFILPAECLDEAVERSR